MNTFEQYTIIKTRIAALEKQAKDMVPGIIADLQSQGLTKAQNALGNATITILKTWTYPKSIINAEEQLKADKAKAQSTGDATCEEAPSLRFVPTKL